MSEGPFNGKDAGELRQHLAQRLAAAMHDGKIDQQVLTAHMPTVIALAYSVDRPVSEVLADIEADAQLLADQGPEPAKFYPGMAVTSPRHPGKILVIRAIEHEWATDLVMLDGESAGKDYTRDLQLVPAHVLAQRYAWMALAVSKAMEFHAVGN